MTATILVVDDEAATRRTLARMLVRLTQHIVAEQAARGLWRADLLDTFLTVIPCESSLLMTTR